MTDNDYYKHLTLSDFSTLDNYLKERIIQGIRAGHELSDIQLDFDYQVRTVIQQLLEDACHHRSRPSTTTVSKRLAT